MSKYELGYEAWRSIKTKVINDFVAELTPFKKNIN